MTKETQAEINDFMKDTAAALLAVIGGFIAEYQPVLQFTFFIIAGLISGLTLINKCVDTYWRLKRWRGKRSKQRRDK